MRKKKQITLYGFFGILADIFLYPVIVVSLLASFFMFYSKRNNMVPSVFGYSMVTILSGSMRSAGFEEGQGVFIQRTDVNKLRAGDVISFYFAEESADKALLENEELILLQEYGGAYETSFIANPSFTPPQRTSKDQLVKTRNSKVYFHEIQKVYADEGGTLFFQTKGTNSGSTEFVRADLVVGKYINTPLFVRNAIAFCGSATGMIILVVAPLSVLILLQLLSIIEQIGNIITEKKVIAHTVRWNSEESIKANVGIEMDNFAKPYLYATVPKWQRKEVAEFMWGHLVGSSKQKDNKKLDEAIRGINLLELSPDSYWRFWSATARSNKQERQVAYYRNLYYIENQTRARQKQIKLSKLELVKSRENMEEKNMLPPRPPRQRNVPPELARKLEVQRLIRNNNIDDSVFPVKKFTLTPSKTKDEVEEITEVRGRGRPRKYPIQEKEFEVNGEKRGRGRPRKYPVLEKEIVEDGEKRGRGRPRKYPIDSENVVTPIGERRGRGRPRKEEIEQTAKDYGDTFVPKTRPAKKLVVEEHERSEATPEQRELVAKLNSKMLQSQKTAKVSSLVKNI